MILCLKRLKTNIIIGVCLILCQISCAPVYIPNTANVPLFTDKGELQAALYVNGFGADAQIAYAASDHIGLMINGKFENYKSDFDEEFRRQSFMEVGAGYFEKVAKDLILEVYGGVGMGTFSGVYNGVFVPDETIDASSVRIFVQPSIGTQFDKIDLSLANRITYVKLDQSVGSSSAFFFEPVVTSRYGFDRLKMVIQAGMSIPLAPELIDFDHHPFLLSFGIHGRLNLRK